MVRQDATSAASVLRQDATSAASVLRQDADDAGGNASGDHRQTRMVRLMAQSQARRPAHAPGAQNHTSVEKYGVRPFVVTRAATRHRPGSSTLRSGAVVHRTLGAEDEGGSGAEG